MNLTIQGNPEDRRKGDKATVNVSKNVGVLERLSLAYYTTPIAVALFHESIVAQAVFYLGKLQQNDNTVLISDLIKTSVFIQDIFKNEFLSKDESTNFDETKVKQILSVAQSKKIAEVDFDKGQLKIVSKSATKNILRFLRDLLQSYADSYLVVAQTISCLQELGVTIEQSKLLSQLHLSIQSLHNDGIIKYMNSCLIEVLQTAFGRFSELGICESQAYDT